MRGGGNRRSFKVVRARRAGAFRGSMRDVGVWRVGMRGVARHAALRSLLPAAPHSRAGCLCGHKILPKVKPIIALTHATSRGVKRATQKSAHGDSTYL